MSELKILPGMPATKADRFSPRWGYQGTVRRRLKRMTPGLWAEIQKRPGPKRIEGYLFEGKWRDVPTETEGGPK